MTDTISLTESFTLPVLSCHKKANEPQPLLGCALLIVGLGIQFSHVVPGWLGAWLGLAIAAVGFRYLAPTEHQTFFEFDPANKKACYYSRVLIAKRFNMNFYRPRKFNFADVRAIMVRLPVEKRNATVSLRLADIDLMVREYKPNDPNAAGAASAFAQELHALMGSPIIEHRMRSNNLGLAIE